MLTVSHLPFDDRIFYKEARSLQKAGYAVSIITSVGHFDEVKDSILIKGFKINPLFLRCKIFGILSIGTIIKFVKFIYYGLKEKADVYHCHESQVLFPAYFIKLLKTFCKKRVYIIHDVHEFYLEPNLLDKNISFWEKVKFRLLIFLDKKINQKIDFIVCTEEPKTEKFLHYHIPCKKIRVIENYVPLDLFQISAKEFNPQKPVFAYAGGLSFDRGINKLAMATAIFAKRTKTKPKLLLLGKSHSPSEEKILLNYYRKNKEFLDLKMEQIPHPEVSKRLREADICFAFYNSKRYKKVLSGKAGPIKLYEYMACGRPVIAVNYDALKNVIEKSRCGIIINLKNGIGAIVNAMEFYYRNPQRIIQDGRNGRLAVEKYYNWSIAEKKLLKIYAGIKKNLY